MTGPPPLRRRFAAAVAFAGLALAASACSSSSTPATTTPSSSTTTTTISAAQKAALMPLLLTTSDLPAGWTLTGAPDTSRAPSCISQVVTLQGARAHVAAVFLPPTTQANGAVIQSVGSFAPGAAQAASATYEHKFLACQDATLDSGGTSYKITVAPLQLPAYGDKSFAAEMTLTAGSQALFLNLAYVAKGVHGTCVVKEGLTKDIAGFTKIVAAAAAKL